MCKHYTVLYPGLEHLQILVPKAGQRQPCIHRVVATITSEYLQILVPKAGQRQPCIHRVVATITSVVFVHHKVVTGSEIPHVIPA